MKIAQLIPVTCLALTIMAASCDKAKQQVAACTDPSCFVIDSFSTELKKRLDGKCIGYGYVITAKDQVVTFNQGGFERMAQDPPQKAFSIFDRMNAASLAKTITGTALLIALDKKGISRYDSIYKYLPASWTFGPLTKTITFADLLSHRSGLRTTGKKETYTGLQDYIATGVTQSNKDIQSYENINYGIMRVLIPILDDQVLTGTDAELDGKYGLAYEKYANQHVISKAGVPYVTCKPDDENQNLCYIYPANGAKGADFGDWTTINGGGGFHISVSEYAAVVRNIFYTSNIIPDSTSKAMRANAWGFDYWIKGKTPGFKIDYIAKGGYYPPGNGGVLSTEFMMFNNNVSVVLYINSQLEYPAGTDPTSPNNPGAINQLILDAFDASKIK